MSQYDSVTAVLNTARSRLNDRLDSLIPDSGSLLDLSQPQTQQIFNSAWRKFQAFLTAKGFTRFESQIVLVNFPAAVSLDPAIECWIDWTGSNNGAVTTPNPALPSDFIAPLELRERQSGTQDVFLDMDHELNGLPTVPKAQWLLMWEWRSDKIYTIGARVPIDLKIRYLSYLPDFDNDDATRSAWWNQDVPIMRCLDPLADYVCREVMIAREDLDGAAAFQTSAEAEAMRIYQRDPARGSALLKDSERGKMRDGNTPDK